MKVIPFKSQGKSLTNDSVIDHGTLLDELNYEIYKRGNIHILDKTLCFKKDCDVFRDELDKIDFNKMKNGDEHLIKGCGDSDLLIFQKVDGEIKIVLRQRGNETIKKLKDILKIHSKR